jgi:hypothetical protein
MPTVFFSYSHADEALRDQLEKQLSLLKRQGVIETWHDRRIGAGQDLHDAIDGRLEASDIILLLVSPDFIDSDYCFEREMTRAMERHHTGDAIVIPIILRPCMWHGAPFGRLMATPKDGKAVTLHPDRDSALLEVATAIKDAAERLGSRPTSPKLAATAVGQVSNAPELLLSAGPRSSNLRLAKQFTDRDKDKFQHDTFDYIAAYFANSLSELGERNAGIEGNVRRIDANRFSASIYRHGKAIARCTIFIGSGFSGNGISYVQGETSESNSYNEHLRVEADDQALFLTSMGMSFERRRDSKLSQEGAAELYWARFIEPVQRGE